MRRVTAVGIAVLMSHTTQAFADAGHSAEAFSRGDYFVAEREWRDSARTGDASAMLGLGTLYDTGHGVPQDFAQALSWYRRAADAGNVQAMFNVGAMYDNGRGTNVNRREAIRWYVMSAMRRNGRAAYAAATIYRDGDGVPKNNAAAIKFYKMAAAAGISAARVNLASLGQSASPAAVATAFPPQGVAPKTPDGRAAPAKHPPAVPSTAPDVASVVLKPPLLPTMSPAVPGDSVAGAAPSRPPAVEPATPDALAGAPNDSFAVTATNIPVGPARQAGPSTLEIVAPGAMAAGIERFHTIALQQADVSALQSKQYEGIVGEIARRAMEGNDVAQYDIGFAYEHGIGLPPDFVRAFAYYIRASGSSEAGLKSAALKEAAKVAERLSDTQFISAADMVLHQLP